MADRESKPGKSDRTRAAILAAAQELFAEQGYERTTVRDVAARAGIDPALVIRYFGGKEGLFARAAVFDLALPDLAVIDRAELGPVLVRHFLEVWEGPGSSGGMTILLRSAASNPIAADKLREVFAAQVLPALARAAGTPDAGERAGLLRASSSARTKPLCAQAAAGRCADARADRARRRGDGAALPLRRGLAPARLPGRPPRWRVRSRGSAFSPAPAAPGRGRSRA